ncbi:MAG: hypothetical protein EA357_02385 [Micavibrio sp.]|nr:MAG: hypothetical protein EA357_02385 [Micavibrio sp.]
MEWILLALAITLIVWMKINYYRTDGPHFWPVTLSLALLYLILTVFPPDRATIEMLFFMRMIIAIWLTWELVAGHTYDQVSERYETIPKHQMRPHDYGMIWLWRSGLFIYGLSLANVLSIPTMAMLKHVLGVFFSLIIPFLIGGYILGLILGHRDLKKLKL